MPDQYEIIIQLEMDIQLWRQCKYTSDEMSVRLHHAARDFDKFDPENLEEGIH